MKTWISGAARAALIVSLVLGAAACGSSDTPAVTAASETTPMGGLPSTPPSSAPSAPPTPYDGFTPPGSGFGFDGPGFVLPPLPPPADPGLRAGPKAYRQVATLRGMTADTLFVLRHGPNKFTLVSEYTDSPTNPTVLVQKLMSRSGGLMIDVTSGSAGTPAGAITLYRRAKHTGNWMSCPIKPSTPDLLGLIAAYRGITPSEEMQRGCLEVGGPTPIPGFDQAPSLPQAPSPDPGDRAQLQLPDTVPMAPPSRAAPPMLWT